MKANRASATASGRLKTYCETWDLQEPALLASTFTSDVFKVKFQESFAVLKILNEKGMKFESKGAIVLSCFHGNGAVQLLRTDGGAHLLEFVDGQQLKVIAAKDDAGATEVITNVVSRLHSYSGPLPEGLIGMKSHFGSLFKKVNTEPAGSIYFEGARLAEYLLEAEQEVRLLHGDIHHENILNSSTRGWLAIDPQGLIGERTYDLANTFFNPKGLTSMVETQETIERRSLILSRILKLDRKRILQYAFAYGCLSACWSLEDGQDEKDTLRIAESIRKILKSLEK